MDERKDLKDNDFYNQACSYFQYHAQQRTAMINFFIAVFGAAIALYGTLLEEFAVASALIAVFLIIVSVLFFLIDLRNRFDVKQSQRVICQIEKDYGKNKNVGDAAYGVFSNEDNTFELYTSKFRKENTDYQELKRIYKSSKKEKDDVKKLNTAIEEFCQKNEKFSPVAVEDSLKRAPICSLSSCIKALYVICAAIGVLALAFALLIVFGIL